MENFAKEKERLNKKYSEELLKVFEKYNIITPEFIIYLKENNFFIQPASTKYHGVYPGALFEHSKNVANKLTEITNNLNIKWQREVSPYLIGYFHDLCKMDSYIRNEDGTYKYNYIVKNLGHGNRSVELLAKFIDLTEEEKLCITYHMGAYETENWNEFDKAIKKYETVLWTHTADMYASKIMEKGMER